MLYFDSIGVSAEIYVKRMSASKGCMIFVTIDIF